MGNAIKDNTQRNYSVFGIKMGIPMVCSAHIEKNEDGVEPAAPR